MPPVKGDYIFRKIGQLFFGVTEITGLTGSYIFNCIEYKIKPNIWTAPLKKAVGLHDCWVEGSKAGYMYITLTYSQGQHGQIWIRTKYLFQIFCDPLYSTILAEH
jgi:hypothetical protein